MLNFVPAKFMNKSRLIDRVLVAGSSAPMRLYCVWEPKDLGRRQLSKDQSSDLDGGDPGGELGYGSEIFPRASDTSASLLGKCGMVVSATSCLYG